MFCAERPSLAQAHGAPNRPEENAVEDILVGGVGWGERRKEDGTVERYPQLQKVQGMLDRCPR
jgi:hypothetical protein